MNHLLQNNLFVNDWTIEKSLLRKRQMGPSRIVTEHLAVRHVDESRCLTFITYFDSFNEEIVWNYGQVRIDPVDVVPENVIEQVLALYTKFIKRSSLI